MTLNSLKCLTLSQKLNAKFVISTRQSKNPLNIRVNGHRFLGKKFNLGKQEEKFDESNEQINSFEVDALTNIVFRTTKIYRSVFHEVSQGYHPRVSVSAALC